MTPDDGMPVACALKFDHIALAQQSRIGAVLCPLPDSRWPEVRDALLTSRGFSDEKYQSP